MIYLDNGATSFRKPPGVYRAVERASAVSLPAGAGRADHQLHPWTEHCHPLHREAGGTGDRFRI